MTTGFRTQLFRPAVRLNTATADIANLDGLSLRIDWSITRDNTNRVDQAEFIVYNLAPKVRDQIYNDWKELVDAPSNRVPIGSALPTTLGYIVEFQLGWRGVAKRVFVGDVWDLIPRQRTPTDTLTIFKCGDGQRNLRDSTIPSTFHNVNIATVLDYLVQLPPNAEDIGGGGLGLIFPKESKALIAQAASELAFTSFTNIPAGSNTKDAIDIVMDTIGLEWRVHNGAFIAMRGGIVNRPGLILKPASGLQSATPRNGGGIDLVAFANPDAEPGVQIQVQNQDGSPVEELAYRTDSVSFSGSTGGSSQMEISASKTELVAA